MGSAWVQRETQAADCVACGSSMQAPLSMLIAQVGARTAGVGREDIEDKEDSVLQVL